MLTEPIDFYIAYAIVLFLAVGIHEYAHCKLADMAGDPTPRSMGRVTLNLTKHFDLMGTMMMVFTTISGFGIGWGKPAPMIPSKMRNPRWDFFIAVIGGPASNLIQAVVWAIFLRLALLAGPGVMDIPVIRYLLLLGVIANLGMTFFNLLPLGVLDGHYLVGLLLPARLQPGWFQFNRSFGFMLLIGLVLYDQSVGAQGGVGPIDMLVYRPVMSLFSILVGQRFQI